MNDELSHKFEDVQPEEMIQILNESFGTPEDVERHKTSCAVFNIRMREGASVIDHVLYMIEKIECLSKFSFSLHEQLGKDVIFNSLPKFYLPFLSHYRMTKPAVYYYGLLGLLQTFEKDHQLQKELVNLVEGSSVGCQSFKRGKKKVQKSRAVDLKQSKISKVDKSHAECFFCKKLYHWKRNYPAYIATLDPNRPKNKRKKQAITSQGTYMITPYNFFIYDTTTWILDIRSLINICNSLQRLQVSRKF